MGERVEMGERVDIGGKGEDGGRVEMGGRVEIGVGVKGCTLVQNNRVSEGKYWATTSSIGSFTGTNHSFTRLKLPAWFTCSAHSLLSWWKSE